jgi:alpha-tubulin suppressor-like RCC1 family protein
MGAAGGNHSCAVTEQGTVKCWGDNEYGQLGDGTTTDRDAPVDVLGLPEVVSVSPGPTTTCAITSAGGVWCWGANSVGQLGDGSTTPRHLPGPVAGLASGVTSISVGSEYACAVTDADEALCWGWNAYGQLGDGTTDDRLVPTPVSGLPAGARRIAAAQYHTCALDLDGAAWCWGDPGSGMPQSSVPVAVPGLGSGLVDIAVGSLFGDSNQRACARTQGGAVLCWGGLLGGAYSEGGSAAVVPGLESGVAALALGSVHSCALMATRQVRCWGRNEYGQLASSEFEISFDEEPAAVYGLTGGALSVSAGWFHTCVVVPGDGMRCWGSDHDGQVGDGPPPAPSATPLPVVGLGSGATHISANPYDPSLSSTCAVANGDAWCWGAFASNPVAGFPPHIPTQVPGFASGVTDISNSGGLACVLATDGSVGCSGPAELSAFAWSPGSATAVSAGGSSVCALLPGGGIQCQGAEMLWDDTWGPYISHWTHTPVGSGMVGVDGFCGLSSAGAVSCWQRHGAPVVVPGLASGIAKYEDGCGITTGGTLLCPGTAIQPIPELSAVTDVSVGSQHMCAVAGGDVYCWGDNARLQLGVPSPVYSEDPVQVPLGESAVEVAAGAAHTCAVTASGAVYCWGANEQGERGDGSVPRPVVPVPVLGLEGVAVPALGAPWRLLLVLGLGVVARARTRAAVSLR